MQSRLLKQQGFTLIEISIVLVIIGLLVGGVLVGRDLIEAAALRGQVSQLEKYQAIINTFRLKYNALPGDMDITTAQSYGFTTCTFSCNAWYTSYGNNLIEYPCNNCNVITGLSGEQAIAWVQLTEAKLLDGGFSMTGSVNDAFTNLTADQIGLHVPAAKLGNGNFIVIGTHKTLTSGITEGMPNYFFVTGISSVDNFSQYATVPTMTPRQAQNMDVKMDDGIANSGKAQVFMVAVSEFIVGQPPIGGTPCFNAVSGAYNVGSGTGNTQICDFAEQFQ